MRFTVAAFVCACASLAPSALATDGDAVALVNGAPISQARLCEVLTDAYGVEVLQQLIVLELAKQETARRGLRVKPADVDAEYQYSLNKIAQEAGMQPEEASDANKREALRLLLDNKRISMAEFMLSMERNAHLRKLAERELRIDEATLREEFARTYGEKALVRHIQIPVHDAARLHEVQNRLARGEDFAELARRYSVNPQTAARGGELEPFAFNADLDPALREAAFSLKPGETSRAAVRTGDFYHFLKLERRIPPEDVRFDDVRETVERSLRERAAGKQMEALALELFDKAKIKVIDRALDERYREFLQRRREPQPP